MLRPTTVSFSVLSYLLLTSCATTPPAGTNICTSDYMVPRAEQYAVNTRANIDRLEKRINSGLENAQYQHSRSAGMALHTGYYALQLQNLRKLDPGMRNLNKDMDRIAATCSNFAQIKSDVLASFNSTNAPYAMKSYLKEMSPPP